MRAVGARHLDRLRAACVPAATAYPLLQEFVSPPRTGTTACTLTGTLDFATGNIVETIDETFTGTAANGARGTIRFVEAISLKGTGDSCHATGHLICTGTADASAIGNGAYSRYIVTPKDCH